MGGDGYIIQVRGDPLSPERGPFNVIVTDLLGMAHLVSDNDKTYSEVQNIVRGICILIQQY